MTTAAREPGDRPRNTAEKSRRVCRHNGLFAAIPTVGENRDGIRQAVDRLPHPYPSYRLPMVRVTQESGVGRRRGRRYGRRLPPSRRSRAAAALERPQPRCMPRCTLIATVPALRCAPRSGHLGDGCAAMAYTCARSTRIRSNAGPAKESACRHTPVARP